MRRISVREAQPGMVLARALYNDRGDVLLNAGIILSGGYVEGLQRRPGRFIYIQDPDTDDIVIEEVISEHLRVMATRNLLRVHDALQQLAQPFQRGGVAEQTRAIGRGDFARRVQELPGREELASDAETIITETLGVENFHGITALQTYDGYTFAHSLDQTIVAVLIGRRLGLARKQVSELASGCLLHDIGKVFISKEVLNKAGPLTPDERAQMREHPRLGYELLQVVRASEVLANQIAHQHHERQDGQGYPRGLQGTNRLDRSRLGDISSWRMTAYAEIAAVADVYEALSSNRSYRAGLPPWAVASELRQVAEVHLNAEVVSAFLAMLPAYPLGTEVIVRSEPHVGYRGVVARVPPEQLDRPVVRLLFDAQGERLSRPVELDLSANPSIVLLGL